MRTDSNRKQMSEFQGTSTTINMYYGIDCFKRATAVFQILNGEVDYHAPWDPLGPKEKEM